MTAPVHFIELYADRGEIAPRLVCTATLDAPCRRRPVNPDAETWTEGDETTPGHDCWTTDFIDGVGFDESVLWGPESGTIVRVPVEVSYDHRGVLAAPVVLPDPADMLPVTPAGTPAPQVGGTVSTTAGLDALPDGSVGQDGIGNVFHLGRLNDDGEREWGITGLDGSYDTEFVAEHLPLTVLFRPDAPQPALTDDVVERAARAIDPAPWRSEHPASLAAREAVREKARAALDAARTGEACECERKGEFWHAEGCHAGEAGHRPDWSDHGLDHPEEGPSCACGFNGTPEECEAARAAGAGAEVDREVLSTLDLTVTRGLIASRGWIGGDLASALVGEVERLTGARGGAVVDRESLVEEIVAAIWPTSEGEWPRAEGIYSVADRVLSIAARGAAAPTVTAEEIAQRIEAEKGDPEFDPGLSLAAEVARGVTP